MNETTSLIREPDNNVVMRSGTAAIRFDTNFGGTPTEIYQEPFSMLTNPHPGSAVSVAWNTGQDPTQGGANGLLPCPIERLNDPTGARLRASMREMLFDPRGKYIVGGIPPQFVLSAEAPDDAVAPTVGLADSGWRTRYRPGEFAAVMNTFECPVIFQGSTVNSSGIMMVGNELKGGNWNERLCEYQNGLMSFKGALSFKYASSGAFAGLIFKKDIGPFANATKDDAWYARGYRWLFNKTGGWDLWRDAGTGTATKLRSGTLNKIALAKLLAGAPGLSIEMRSFPQNPGVFTLYIDDILISSVSDLSPIQGKHMGLFGSCNSGFIQFSNREFYDMNVEFTSCYEALGNESFQSDVIITSTTILPNNFYRCNPPAVFLNKTTFSGGRTCLVFHDDGDSMPFKGMCLMSEYAKYWCGNAGGTAGVLATPLLYELDGKPSPGGHLLMDDHAGVNDEFVLMLNPLPANQITSVKKIRMVTRWQTHI